MQQVDKLKQKHPAAPVNVKLNIIPAGVDYVRVSRLARLLDMSTKRIYQLIQEQRLQAVKLGPRQTRVSLESVRDYLARSVKNDECEA